MPDVNFLVNFLSQIFKETEYSEVEGKESNIIGEPESCTSSQSMSTPSRQTSISSSSGSIAKTEPGIFLTQRHSCTLEIELLFRSFHIKYPAPL